MLKKSGMSLRRQLLKVKATSHTHLQFKSTLRKYIRSLQNFGTFDEKRRKNI